jgi:hypothetical protein
MRFRIHRYVAAPFNALLQEATIAIALWEKEPQITAICMAFFVYHLVCTRNCKNASSLLIKMESKNKNLSYTPFLR